VGVTVAAEVALGMDVAVGGIGAGVPPKWKPIKTPPRVRRMSSNTIATSSQGRGPDRGGSVGIGPGYGVTGDIKAPGVTGVLSGDAPLDRSEVDVVAKFTACPAPTGGSVP